MQYVTIHDYNVSCSDDKGFNFMTYNVRSFSVNFDTFFTMFENAASYPEVLCLTETWLNANNARDIPEYLAYHTSRVSGRYGGESIYIIVISFYHIFYQFFLYLPNQLNHVV